VVHDGGMVDDTDDRIRFPDAPKTELDQALVELFDTAGRVMVAQGRLRNLLEATRAVVHLADLPLVLTRIAEVAVDLVGARYAALGVIAPDGSIERFFPVGMSDDEADAIGHLPEGHGLLGALIADPHPIRLENLKLDPRSSGFPPGHPDMESFLGVPIRVRDEVFGNIYVTQSGNGAFTEEDQELLTALAATAGIAIDNARLLEETRRRQRWSAAAAEITGILVSEQAHDSLGLIAERVVELAEADLVTVVLPAGQGSLIVDTARGTLADGVVGLVFPAGRTLAGRTMESGQPILADDNTLGDAGSNPWLPLGPSMAIPLGSSSQLHGVLTVSRALGRRRFTRADMDMAADFAGQASVALALARGRAAGTRLALLEERGRIARDLHDHVIQRLFGAGMALHALDLPEADGVTRARIDETVRALDDSIAEIRTAIFALVSPDARERGSLRHRIIDVVSELSPAFPSSPRVVFAGAVDLLVPEELSDDIVAVVREGLANCAKHANASETALTVAVDETSVVVELTDDGVGLDPPGAGGAARASGTANLEARARAHGGSFSLCDRDGGGTRLRWTASIAPREAAS